MLLSPYQLRYISVSKHVIKHLQLDLVSFSKSSKFEFACAGKQYFHPLV